MLKCDDARMERIFALVRDSDFNLLRQWAGGITESLRVDWRWAAWHAKIGTILGDSVPPGALHAGDFAVACGKERPAVSSDLFGSAGEPAAAGDGHVGIDRSKGSFTLSTGRTSGGFAERGEIVTENFRAVLSGAAAIVWVSSLDGRDIVDSKRMLVSHLTDMQNTGARFADSARTVVQSLGGLPYLMRNGSAAVAIRVSGREYAVHALETDGTRRRAVPCTVDGGAALFVPGGAGRASGVFPLRNRADGPLACL